MKSRAPSSRSPRLQKASHSRAYILGFGLALLAGTHWLQAQSITYTKIASTTTTVPGSSNTFSNLGLISLDGNNVAFLGVTNGSGVSGIYTSTISGLSLSRVADSTITATDTGASMSGTLGNFGTPIISGNTVAFQGATNGAFGVYTGTLGTVGASLVMQVGDPAPEPHDKFSTVSAPSISGTHVAYFANYQNDGTGGTPGSGIFVGTSGQHSTPTALSDRQTPISGHVITSYSSTISADGNLVAFRAAYSGGGGGVYVENTDGTSQTLIADNNTPLPGNPSATFTGINLASPVVSGTNVAFATNGGVYLKDATGLHTIADSSTFVPGLSGVQFSSGGFSSGISLDGGNVAFVAAFSGGSGLFEEYNGTLYAIATNSGQSLPSDTLFGDPVNFYQISNGALDGNHIAFQYTANNSGGPTGVAIATIGVPEPSVGISLLGGLGLFAMGRRRRKP